MTLSKIIAALVLGLFSLALYVFGGFAKGNRDTFSCQSNLKQIGLGLKQYERDYDEKTVLSGNWKTALWPYTKSEKIFRCPAGNSYAHNRFLSGASLQQLTDNRDYTGTPTVFDSNSTKPNAADFGTSYVANGAHEFWRRGRGTNVLFFDGHVEWLQQKPIFQAIKPLPMPLPPTVIRRPPVKRDALGRVIIKIERAKPR